MFCKIPVYAKPKTKYLFCRSKGVRPPTSPLDGGRTFERQNVTNYTDFSQPLRPYHVFIHDMDSYDSKFLTYFVFQPIFTVIIVPMNILLVWAFIRGGFRSPTHVVLIAIAIFNNINLLSIAIPSFYFYVLDYGKDYVPFSWCLPFMLMMNRIPKICASQTLYLTVLLGLHRYLIVKFPLKVNTMLKNGQTIFLVFVLTGIAISCDLQYIVAISDIYPLRVESLITPGTNVTGCAWKTKPTIDVNAVITDIASTFLPIAVLIILTVMFIWINIKQIRSIRRSRLGNSDRDTRRMIVITTCILSSVILVSVPEVIIKQILFTHGRPCKTCIVSKTKFTLIMHCLTNLTFAANFIIYSCLSEKFRIQLRRILCIRIFATSGSHTNGTSNTSRVAKQTTCMSVI